MLCHSLFESRVPKCISALLSGHNLNTAEKVMRLDLRAMRVVFQSAYFRRATKKVKEREENNGKRQNNGIHESRALFRVIALGDHDALQLDNKWATRNKVVSTSQSQKHNR